MTLVRPIQIIGTQRSGSNLLRVMMNQFPEISAPHPPHILQRFMPLLRMYTPLSEAKNFDRLINDVCTLVECNPVPWEGLSFNREQIKDNCQNNSLIDIFRVIYDLKARHDHASYWVCKSMANINFANQIEKNGMHPLYIHLFRDGRDVACSFKNAIVGEKHVFHIANQWRDNQEACLELKAKLSPDRLIQVSYENLLLNPEKEIKKISAFLNIRYQTGILDFFKSKESKNTAVAGKMWANVSKPLLKNNTKKYLVNLSSLEIEIFEKQAGKTLQKLGYTTENKHLETKSYFSEDQIKDFDAENKLLKAKAIARANPEDLKLRQAQITLLNHIKNRQ